MSTLVRPTQAAVFALVVAFGITDAFAAPPHQTVEDPDNVDPRAGTPRPAAPDRRGGTFGVIARGGFAAPAGSITTEVASEDVGALGPAIGGALELGLSRYVAIEALGRYATFGSTARCPDCKFDNFGVGLGLTYYPVQALAIEPWIHYGMGYRLSDIAAPPAATGPLKDLVSGSYHGWDIANVALGATFLPLDGLGVGPYLFADFGTYAGRPGGALQSSAYVFAGMGLTLTLRPQHWFERGVNAGVSYAGN